MTKHCVLVGLVWNISTSVIQDPQLKVMPEASFSASKGVSRVRFLRSEIGSFSRIQSAALYLEVS